jgi:uncharacterized membrane protein YkvA (DUF1232 family)
MDQRYSGSRLAGSQESARAAIAAWARRRQARLFARSLAAHDAVRAWQARVAVLCAQQLQLVRREIHVLSLVARDARTPWYAKLIAALAVGYAFSPIQLIPSFIPVLGLLDDVVILSLGMRLALWLTPSAVLASCRERVEELRQGEGDSGNAGRRAIIVVGAIWLIMVLLSLVSGAALVTRFL